MAKRALILFPPGSEETEPVICYSVLTRGKVDAKICSLCGKDPIRGSQGLRLLPDIDLKEARECGNYDVIILSGGSGGTDALKCSKDVGKILKDFECKNKMIAAIDTGPLALLAHEVLFGKSLTGYPTAKAELSSKYTYKECPVIIDENLVTSKGPGTAFIFAKTLLELLTDKKTACEVGQAMLIEEK